MDVVWMAKSFSLRLLKNDLGQSAVEYILLLAVLSSLGYTFYNNKKLKDFLKGTDGLFAIMKKGMSYSYRYGIEFDKNTPYEEKLNFEYQNNQHDTYLNPGDGKSRFFSGKRAYPQ
jgi:hypothetical protein